MKPSNTAIRVLLGCAAALVLFGLVSALLLDSDDDDGEAAGDTTTTTAETTTTTEGGDDSTTTSSTSSSSSSSTSTTSTASTSSTSTTRATSTTQPAATTTTVTSGPTTTVPGPTTVPENPQADLVLSRTPLSPPVFRFTTQNAGPDAASAVELVVTVDPDMTITSAVGREGMTCAVEGATVRCTVEQAPVGGRVGGAQLEVSGSGQVRASVRSATPDPDLRDNTVVAVAT